MRIDDATIQYMESRGFDWVLRDFEFRGLFRDTVDALEFRDVAFDREIVAWIAQVHDPLAPWCSIPFDDPISAYVYAETAGWKE